MHIAIFLFGFTAILGKLITLKEIPLVWNRLWVAVLGLIILPGVLRGLTRISAKNLLRFSGIGVIVALHWITFYGSIKIGNSASITLACLATTSLFTSLLEPLITKSKFNWIELILGLLVILGIILLTGVGELYYTAIIVGLISAFLAAFFSVLNKKYITGQNTISVSVVELFSGFVFISLCFPLISIYGNQSHWFPQNTDWLWIAILGIFCTSIAYVLSLNSLKELSAFVANLSINLEPVYGIILAALIFHESQDLNLSFYLGTSIILLAVLLHPVLVKIEKQKRKRGIVQ
jgi:drug/metabolite transporter (DMT)-like permease